MAAKDDTDGVVQRLGAIEARMESMEAKIDQLLSLQCSTNGQNGHRISSMASDMKTSLANLRAPGGLLGKATERTDKFKPQVRPPNASELLNANSKLRRVETKESNGEAAPNEIAAIAAIYTRNGGDPEKIARETAADANLIRRNPPADERDFAHRLLQGAYTRPGGEVVIRIGCPPTADMLQAGRGNLQKAPAPVESSVPTDREVAVVSGIWARFGGDLEKVAAALGANPALLRKTPPADADDFGLKLLMGLYTDWRDVADVRLASGLAGGKMNFAEADLRDAGGKLNKVEVEVDMSYAKPSEADLAAVASLWEENGGDLQKIAAMSGANIALLEAGKPKDGKEFAERLLRGDYTDQQSEQLRALLGDRFKQQLQSQGRRLKKVPLDSAFARRQPTPEDVAILARMYTERGGDLQKLAEATGSSASLLSTRPPKDAVDFAERLLQGAYVDAADRAGLARSTFRARMATEILERAAAVDRSASLQLDGTPQGAGPSAADLEAAAMIYTDNVGELARIAALTGCDARLLTASPPKDAQDFAKQLLAGAYVGEAKHVVLRRLLSNEMLSAKEGLKKVDTAEIGSGTGPTQAEIQAMAKLYADLDGNLEKLAGVTASSKQILLKNPPKDGEDFAKKLLDGAYVGSPSDIARKELYSHLKDALVAQRGQLATAETKQGAACAPSAEEKAALERIYKEAGGSPEELARRCGADIDLLRRSMPENATEFATKLFQGMYMGEASDVARFRLRAHLQDLLAGSKAKLKPTEVKEGGCSAEPAGADVEVVAKIFEQHCGDADKLAELFGFQADALRKNPPGTAHDFARLLLSGAYSED